MIFDVYGFGEPDLGDQLDLLAGALGVRWERRESEYRGVTYRARGLARGEGKMLVQSNDLGDEAGSYHQLPDFPEFRFLLFVDKFERPDEVRAKLTALPQWRFLYRSVVE